MFGLFGGDSDEPRKKVRTKKTASELILPLPNLGRSKDGPVMRRLKKQTKATSANRFMNLFAAKAGETMGPDQDISLVADWRFRRVRLGTGRSTAGARFWPTRPGAAGKARTGSYSPAHYLDGGMLPPDAPWTLYETGRTAPVPPRRRPHFNTMGGCPLAGGGGRRSGACRRHRPSLWLQSDSAIVEGWNHRDLASPFAALANWITPDISDLGAAVQLEADKGVRQHRPRSTGYPAHGRSPWALTVLCIAAVHVGLVTGRVTK
jgi:hypothetical protein